MRSGNGSSIIIYGHDNGISVWWQGGRPLKQKKSRNEGHLSSQNGHGSAIEDVMVIDSDEDESLPKGADREAQSLAYDFEAEEDEPDPYSPYEPVIAHAHIDLGTAVHRVAVPPLPADLATRMWDTVPTAFSRLVVVAITCSDRSTRIITIPLTPSRRATVAHLMPDQDRDEEVSMSIVTARERAHQSIPKQIAITYTAVGAPSIDLNAHSHDEKEYAEWRIWLKHHHHEGDRDNGKWNLIITSYSAEPLPTLITTRLHYSDPAVFALDADEAHTVNETSFLPSRLASLSFSPSRFPSPRHTRLLMSEPTGVVRGCEVLLVSDDNPYDEMDVNMRVVMKWLFTLQAPSQSSPTNPAPCNGTRKLLSAEWALQGRAILVLLHDGQWGVWDLEGAGPVAQGASAHSGQGYLLGAGVTQFTIRGYLDHTHNEKAGFGVFRSSVTKPKESTKLAPMTPNTRKARQETFFSRPTSIVSGSSVRSGGLSVSKIMNAKGSRSLDESILFWYGSGVYAVPSLMAFWQRALSSVASGAGAGSFGTHYGPNVLKISGLSTLGAFVSGVSQLPHHSISPSESSVHMQHDILVSAEHRLIMLCSEQASKPTTAQIRSLFESTNTRESGETGTRRLDDSLLRRGEMDLGGMNRILDGMANGGSADFQQQSPLARPRKVGFAN